MTVDDLLVIGTALKNAKAIIDVETNRNSEAEGIDNAISIIDKIIDEGTT